MRFLTYNAGGLKRGARGQMKGNWLLSFLSANSDVVALALQETHCQCMQDFCQAFRDIAERYTVICSPPDLDDSYAGVALVISREYEVEAERVMLGGRVLAVRVRSLVYGSVFDLVVVYGYPAGRREWLGEMEGAVDSMVPCFA